MRQKMKYKKQLEEEIDKIKNLINGNIINNNNEINLENKE